MTNSITIIGCRAGSPAHDIPASGYLLHLEDKLVLIDCGSGVALRLAMKDHIHRLSAVIVTHAHADHTLDLVALTYNRLFPKALPRIPLFGPPSLKITLDLLDQAYGIPTLPSLTKPLALAFDFHPVEPGSSFLIGKTCFETLRNYHPTETFALRIPGFVFTSDTSLSSELVNFSINAPILLAEATYPDGQGHNLDEHGHMTGEQAGELAQRARVFRLVLTHLSDFDQAERTIQAARSRFSGEIILAKPDLTMPITVEDDELTDIRCL